MQPVPIPSPDAHMQLVPTPYLVHTCHTLTSHSSNRANMDCRSARCSSWCLAREGTSISVHPDMVLPSASSVVSGDDSTFLVVLVGTNMDLTLVTEPAIECSSDDGRSLVCGWGATPSACTWGSSLLLRPCDSSSTHLLSPSMSLCVSWCVVCVAQLTDADFSLLLLSGV